MRYLHEKTGFALRLAVLATLLAAQCLALAHELDHVGNGEASLCAVCSASTGLDTPVQVEHQAPTARPAAITGASLPPVLHIRVIATPLTARAPPPAS